MRVFGLILVAIVFWFAVGLPARANQEVCRSKLDEHYANRFVGLLTKTLSEAADGGRSVSSLTAPVDVIWRSMLIVAMQRAPVIYVSKKEGSLVAPPYVLYVENQGDQLSLHAYFMAELFQEVGDPDETCIDITEENKKTLLDTMLTQIVTRVSAGGKPKGAWSYLPD